MYHLAKIGQDAADESHRLSLMGAAVCHGLLSWSLAPLVLLPGGFGIDWAPSLDIYRVGEQDQRGTLTSLQWDGYAGVAVGPPLFPSSRVFSERYVSIGCRPPLHLGLPHLFPDQTSPGESLSLVWVSMRRLC